MKASKLFKITFSLLLIAALLFSAGCKGPDAQTDGTAGSTGNTATDKIIRQKEDCPTQRVCKKS